MEFDFHNDTNKNEPSYPHLSVQYTAKPEVFRYEQDQSTDFRWSIASKYLMSDDLQDEKIHNVRVVYDPDLTAVNFKERPITRSKYLSKLLQGSDLSDE